MTIIAASIEMDRILLVADCRVTFLDKQRHDALQKVYPLGPNALVAFAGSVSLASSSLLELFNPLKQKRNPKLHKVTNRLARISQNKAEYNFSKGQNDQIHCNFLVVGYSGKVPYLATVNINGLRDSTVQVLRVPGQHSVIGSGEAERANCRKTIARGGLESFNDEQAVHAFGGFLDAGLSLVAIPDRFDDGIGDLKMSFTIRKEGWRFVPMHTEMFRGRIADRNQPLGYASVHSVTWNDRSKQFQLKDHQTGTTFPLLNVLSKRKYELRGKVKSDFDPYKLKT